MSLLLLGAAGISAGVGLFRGRSQRKSGKESIALAGQQEEMAYENRRLELMELEEGIRRTELQNSMTRGTAKSRAAAGGLKLEGSLNDYLGFMEENQGAEVSWMREAGESRANQTLQDSLLQASATKIGGEAQKREGIASSIGGIGIGASILGGGGGLGLLGGGLLRRRRKRK